MVFVNKKVEKRFDEFYLSIQNEDNLYTNKNIPPMKSLRFSLALLTLTFVSGSALAQTTLNLRDLDLDVPQEDSGDSINVSNDNVSISTDEEEDFLSAPDVEIPVSALPSSAKAELRVINISKGNQDAMAVGAAPGDVLRVEYNVVSQTAPIIAFAPSFNASNLLSSAEPVDLASVGATRVGDTIVFQPYSQAAPCENTFAFFVRVQPCDESHTVSVSIDGQTVRVPLTCTLAQSGSGMWGIVGLIGFVLTSLYLFGRRSLA